MAYIEREYAVDAVLDVYCNTPDIDLSCEKFEAAILKIPAADVAPVRHGRWIIPRRKIYGIPQYVCSVCKKSDYWKKYFCHGDESYCPNCGAKMDLKE